jgi:dTDP-4-dehydrorhamnose 3,5-epimerase
MHEISRSPVLGLQVVRPSVFKDFRGEYTETYNRLDVFPDLTFVQDSAILSTRGVLRGYHGDDRTWKLITCLYGTFQIAFMCIDPRDPRFGQCERLVLDDQERLSVLLPPKFVNAHQCLSDCFFTSRRRFIKVSGFSTQ